MLPLKSNKPDYQIPTTKPDQKPEAPRSLKRYHDDIGTGDIGTADTSGKLLAKRICRLSF